MSKDIFRIVFIGTSDFGIPALESLINDDRFDVVGVITQPDKKTGRKQELSPSPIKVIAEKNSIPVWQPEKISKFEMPFKEIDLIVVIAYAQILKDNIINIPRYGCFNLHGSLLPKYRGAACIQQAILNGDEKTGITIIKIDKGLDTGPILDQSEINIEKNDTTGILFEKLSKLGSELLIPTLIKYVNKKLILKAQDNSKSSYVGLLSKDDGRIDWSQNAEQLEKFIRAMNPWPSAFSYSSDKSLIKIIEVDPNLIKSYDYEAGQLFDYRGVLAVQCKKDALQILKIQPAGKKPMSGKEFMRGYSKLLNTSLN